MITNKIFKMILAVLITIAFLSPIAFAGIKERMKQRLPVIAALKAKGVIGENNKGYLGYVTGKKEREDVIAAENKDRKAVYSHFAKQQNTTLSVVEKVQAKRKAQKAGPGEYIQNDDGTWIKK